MTNRLVVIVILLLSAGVALAETQAPTNIDNCCFVDRQCATNQEWVAGYQAFQRNECPVSQPVAPVSAPVSAPAGQPVDNCCFVNRQCATEQEWVAGYQAFQRNECPVSQPVAPVSAPVSAPAGQPVDNCCFVNRQCATEQEWVAGYQAFQRNECLSSQPATQGTSVQTSSAPQQIPAGVDNCCQVNMQCAGDEDWRRGWAAYKHYQCRADVPVLRADVPVLINGGAGFREQILEAFLMLQRAASYWYDYTIRELNKVQQTGSYANTYVDVDTKVFYLHYDDPWPTGRTRREHIVFTASILAHEACHVHRYEAGLEHAGLVGERACTERQLEAHIAMDPHDPRADEHRKTLATIHDPSTWWWE